MQDQKNMILAIALSAAVVIVWQYFFGLPQMEKQRQEALLKQQQQQTEMLPQATAPAQPGAPPQPQTQTPSTAPQAPGQGGAPTPTQQLSREAVLAQSPRVRVETPRLSGSIALKGGRVDDLSLTQYHETVDP